MRELEFLPTWYPQLRRRRRLLFIQLWATIGLAIGLMSWVVITNRSVAQKQLVSRSLDRDLQQSRADLKQLDEMLDTRQSLQTQQQVVSKMGTNVEVSRLMSKLDQVMPKEMSLTLVSIDTIEQVKAADNKSTGKPGDQTRVVTRKQNIHLQGVTPSDADWATMLSKLGSIPYLQDVELLKAQEKSDNGHLMREFEVSFSIDLGDGE